MRAMTDLYAVMAWVLGLVLGSFLNVVAHRLPRGESVVFPASHCPHCGRPLRPAELVPVLSWLVLGGRCRTCRHPVSVRYPVLEMGTGALLAATVWATPAWPQRLTWAVFWLLLVAALGTDLAAMRVPDVLTLPGAVVSTVLSGATGVQTWLHAVAGAAAGFAVLWALHLVSRGNMGLGDAKLYLSIGAMLGPVACLESLVLASLSGALVGAALRLFRALRRREPMPFVPHIAVGVVATVYFGASIVDWYTRLWA